ncbi:MAG TPA: class I tRNA ligase family protein [Solirubrobacteraceae bacterium]|jgi:leucyl-tRNA synthetase|nr:class I tRNA ligase family protein [Solirubrobacteraceae bacterium]
MSDDNLADYDPQVIEARRQAVWREQDAFRTPEIGEDRARKYIKPSAPFTSGNIHIGHVRSYSIGDAYARFCRGRGEDVLFAFGFDSFGLPAELGAIAGKEPPSAWVNRCAEHMIVQLRRLGFSFDWERTFMSSEAIMYRWSQWLFLTLLEAGLVYRGTGSVDWCDTCQTVLATIQVEDGTCWRCHHPVRLIQRPQWYLRISEYVPENDRRLAELAASGIWDENALASQRFVLGRVDGVELDLLGQDGEPLTVFTPHTDALDLARFVSVSPRHPQVDEWARDQGLAQRLDELRAVGLERSAREAQTMPFVETGRLLASPTGGEPLPVIVTPTVDGRFGPTAVFGVPERDRTDALIAERLFGRTGFNQTEQAEDDPARAGGPPSGETTTRPHASVPGTRTAVRYRANDFTISRQRSWGTPIPIVYCDGCGAVPLPKDALPVILPLDLTPTGTGNPLAEREDFVRTTCPKCGGTATRETDTLDCHFDALWLWVPVCVPPTEREQSLEHILALDDLRAWLPCERVVAGSDSGNFVFDQRTVTKALRDIGPLEFLSDGEPFAGCLFHEMVIRDGRKMSKHLGNVVDPDELVAQYGADTVRLAVLYAARAQRSLNWSDGDVKRCHRFLRQLWDYSHARFTLDPAELSQSAANGASTDGDQNATMGADKTEHLRKRLEQWCETAVEKITEDARELEMHSAVRNVMRLFDRIRDYEKRVIAKRGSLCAEDYEALIESLRMLARVLMPFAPHIAEQLLIDSTPSGSEIDTSWPRGELVPR